MAQHAIVMVVMMVIMCCATGDGIPVGLTSFVHLPLRMPHAGMRRGGVMAHRRQPLTILMLNRAKKNQLRRDRGGDDDDTQKSLVWHVISV